MSAAIPKWLVLEIEQRPDVVHIKDFEFGSLTPQLFEANKVQSFEEFWGAGLQTAASHHIELGGQPGLWDRPGSLLNGSVLTRCGVHSIVCASWRNGFSCEPSRGLCL